MLNRGQPFGGEDWVDRMTKRFGLGPVFRRAAVRQGIGNNGS